MAGGDAHRSCNRERSPAPRGAAAPVGGGARQQCEGSIPRHAWTRAQKPTSADRELVGARAPPRWSVHRAGADHPRPAASARRPTRRRPARCVADHARPRAAFARDGDLAEIITSAVERSRPLIDESKHELVVNAETGLLVCGDAGRLTQVVSNLLTNAAKYTHPGGRIELSARRTGEHVVVDVGDNGMGIEPEMLPRVFELFMQNPRSLDRSKGGLGLGLAIVRALISAHEAPSVWQARAPAREAHSPSSCPPRSTLPWPRATDATTDCDGDASSSSMTTRTPLRPWPRLSTCSESRLTAPTTANLRSRSRRRSVRRSPSSTSACRTSMATSWRAVCGPSAVWTISCSSRSPGTIRHRIGTEAERPGSTPTSPSRSTSTIYFASSRTSRSVNFCSRPLERTAYR